ncbi:YcnI family copper-binding membrane protein [Paenibacillus sp. SYP-B4298]|uniref:YcnI family copper-binding membrane protein n=1 Tax=Paenibacillus sp. SYP-B4298 TaxID=2996034 RepID=UPI0022DD5DB5|nr:YcnI family protein [Paenibacillus sp. SYP-B4298]
MKKWLSTAMALMVMLMFASVASAHVTVKPVEVSQGSYEVFTVRVPSENKGTTTQSIEIRVPEGVDILRVEPKPGWTYTLSKEGERITSVAWSAEGEGLKETEFTEFRFQGKVGADATELNWKAYQTYADGSKADWVEAADGQYPASVTAVTPGTGDGHGHGGHGADSSAAQPAASTDAGQPAADSSAASGHAGESAAASPAEAGAASNGLDRGLAIAALALGVIAVIIALVRKPAAK